MTTSKTSVTPTPFNNQIFADQPDYQSIPSNPALQGFWSKKARYKVLYGGRASSKSWDAAITVIRASMFCTFKCLCCRQHQNKIEESVYTLLKFQIDRMNLNDDFQIYNNKIINKTTRSEFIFYGLSRNIEEIKSTEGVDICWIEEAASLTKKQWLILDPTLRKQGSQFWIIFNPDCETDFIYQKFVVHPPENSVVRKINYDENVFLSKTMLKVIQATKTSDYDEYEHVYLGFPRKDNEMAIIKRHWLTACVDAHKKLGLDTSGGRRIGFDIADAGGDRCVNAIAYGSVLVAMSSWKASEDDLLKSIIRTWETAQEHSVFRIIYDATGVGASAGAMIKSLNQTRNALRPITPEKFIAGGAVDRPDQKYKHGILNKDMFSNYKAQCWWHVADRIRNTWDAVNNGNSYPLDDIISISSDIDCLEALLTELSIPKRDYDGADRVKVESKKDLIDRGIKSPDLADAFVMAFSRKMRMEL